MFVCLPPTVMSLCVKLMDALCTKSAKLRLPTTGDQGDEQASAKLIAGELHKVVAYSCSVKDYDKGTQAKDVTKSTANAKNEQ